MKVQVAANHLDHWESLYRADPDALPTQAPEWVAAAGATGRFEDASQRFDFGGSSFVLPALRLRVAGRKTPVASSFPEAWGIGGLVGPGQTPEVIRAVVEQLRAGGFKQVSVRPNPLHAHLWESAELSDVVTVDAHAHVVDLRSGADAVWDRFHSTKRRNVRRAERSELEIECDTTGRLVGVFHGLLEQSFERWAGQQREPAAVARWRGNRRDPISKFEAIAEALGDRCRIWVATQDGRPAASLLVLQDRNSHYTRGAMDKELAGPTRANDLLHWLAMKDAAAADCASYHMGATRLGSSLARFKEGFGAEPVHSARYQIEQWPLGRVDRALRRAAKRVLRMDDA